MVLDITQQLLHDRSKVCYTIDSNLYKTMFQDGVHDRCVSQIYSNCEVYKKPVYVGKNTCRKSGLDGSSGMKNC